ncbi:mRNA-decapping enzyme subunit 2 [Myotisia sp. PD_48]|nr:mRNA-decapping enzyme subunit 2 [Myotisia sp. PD_48]
MTGLDDLCVRFIVNLPREELESVERICFQVEEAQWFYEDFIRPLDPNLPSLSLRAFALRIFQHCPLMSQWSHYHHSTAFSEFLAYKTRVPVRGAIMLNQDMDEVVLVKGWKKGANWSFPRGKINKDEKDLDCAIREVYEETGFDIGSSGLVQDEDKVKYIELAMREQNMRLYVLRGVPKDTEFAPRTRKEISKIQWYRLSDLPTLKKSKQNENGNQSTNTGANKFYLVAPFLGPLKRWIARQRKLDLERTLNPPGFAFLQEPVLGVVAEDDEVIEEKHLPINNDNLGEYHDGLGRMALPSDLPEVSMAQDPSDQLKRLLNIGNAPVLPVNQSTELQQTQQPHPDFMDGNALLALLRRGSEAHPPDNPPFAPAPLHPSVQPPAVNSVHFSPQPVIEHSSFTSLPQQPPPLPPQINFSHPSLQHTQNATQTGSGPDPRYGYPEPNNTRNPQYNNVYIGHLMQQHSHVPNNPPFAAYQPPPPLPQPQGIQQSIMHHGIQSGGVPQQMPVANQNSQRTAPRAHTGDSLFASTRLFPNLHVPSVPDAAALPRPKLSDHSLSLLSVFKNEAIKKSEPQPKESPSQLAQNAAVGAPNPQHQKDLLSLLKRPGGLAAANIKLEHTPPQAELASRTTPRIDDVPVRTVLAAKERIQPHVILPKSSNTASGPATTQNTAATLSAPLNLPNFEGIAKPSNRRSHISPSRPPRAVGLAPKQNITILPRPVSNQVDTAPASASPSRYEPPPPQTPPKQNPKISELAQTFKPKRILRRPDRDNLEANLPSHTVTVSAFTKPGSEPAEVSEPEQPKQRVFDRRPSQTTAQRDTLLSLFGKAQSATPGSEKEAAQPSPIFNSPSLKTPVLTSPPYSSMISPATESQVSSRGHTPGSGPNKSRVTSPTDKAFLLDYLDGVAKGRK